MLGPTPAEYFAFHGPPCPAKGYADVVRKRTVLVGHHPPLFRGLRTRAIPIGDYVFCLRWEDFLIRLVTVHIINVHRVLLVRKESYSKLRKNARLLENTNRFSSCDVMLPQLSLSYGKRNSLKTPQRARALPESTSLFPCAEEACSEALLEDAGAPIFAREETEAFPMESEYFSAALDKHSSLKEWEEFRLKLRRRL